MGATETVGVSFRQADKIYYFDTAGLSLKVNDYVVVGASHCRGLSKGVVSSDQTLSAGITEVTQSVLRLAQPKDMKQAQRAKKKEAEALAKCREFVAELNLAMKPLSAHCNLDGKQIILFFSAEQRVDFRELVRRLSRELEARVELRQVRARD